MSDLQATIEFALSGRMITDFAADRDVPRLDGCVNHAVVSAGILSGWRVVSMVVGVQVFHRCRSWLHHLLRYGGIDGDCHARVPAGGR